MFELLTQPEIKERIRKMSHAVMPKTWWSGENKETGVLEIYSLGTKKRGGYQPRLITGKPEKRLLEKIEATIAA